MCLRKLPFNASEQTLSIFSKKAIWIMISISMSKFLNSDLDSDSYSKAAWEYLSLTDASSLLGGFTCGLGCVRTSRLPVTCLEAVVANVKWLGLTSWSFGTNKLVPRCEKWLYRKLISGTSSSRWCRRICVCIFSVRMYATFSFLFQGSIFCTPYLFLVVRVVGDFTGLIFLDGFPTGWRRISNANVFVTCLQQLSQIRYNGNRLTVFIFECSCL